MRLSGIDLLAGFVAAVMILGPMAMGARSGMMMAPATGTQLVK